MKREFKFRAWDKEEEVLLCDISIQNDTWDMLNEFFEHFDELIFMQYTGLKDKNGVEIYEGDIIRVYELDRKEEVDYIAPVVWKDLGWVVLANENLDMPLFTLDDSRDWVGSVSEIEVIGNIHENPELLKGGITC